MLGDEAVAQAAIDAGLSAAYGYPGTPSTEILEFLIGRAEQGKGPRASWCTNEKTAYEQALGVSLVGRRSMVTMKHVGLNVAADPFVNSALIELHGGLAVVVADDPGMHSSQNEQDTRYLADFAHTLCLEPSSPQEAYAMTRDAFELSEWFHVPVVLRLVTRLAHSRAPVARDAARPENPLQKPKDRASWILLPGNARKQWHKLLDRQRALEDWSESCAYNALELSPHRGGLGVITTGVARTYFLENAPELKERVSHLHLGAYPIPQRLVRRLAEHCSRVLVLEEGYPFVERLLRGLVPTTLQVQGRMTGEVAREGELTPDGVRAALGLAARRGLPTGEFKLPQRPPQLCPGCPHSDSYGALSMALEGFDQRLVTSDIGCYTLGATAPYEAIETCVDMGASVGLAKGAVDAGFHPVVAVIGDSTFLHSGISGLIDAIAQNTDMTLYILDNLAVAMTGGQATALPPNRLEKLVLGLGADPAHVKVIEAHRKFAKENAAVLRAELEYRGLSVVIAVRECIETLKRHKPAPAEGR